MAYLVMENITIDYGKKKFMTIRSLLQSFSVISTVLSAQVGMNIELFHTLLCAEIDRINNPHNLLRKYRIFIANDDFPITSKFSRKQNHRFKDSYQHQTISKNGGNNYEKKIVLSWQLGHLQKVCQKIIAEQTRNRGSYPNNYNKNRKGDK